MTMTLSYRQTTADRAKSFKQALQELEAGVTGSVLLPGDTAYDSARRIRNLSIDRFPAVVVQAECSEDVAAAIRFAREHGLKLSVRSGGHSFAGHSTNDDGVVIDMRRMHNVEVNPEARTARAQPGATSGELYAATAPHGLALSTGDTSSVALGGLTLGGGIGWMARKQGLTIDNLISAEMVTADGRIVRATAQENPDLFWALRGGGGNFGVVTEFEYRLHAVDTIYGGMIGLPFTRETVKAYADWAINAPNELTTICFVMEAPPAPFVPEDVVGQTSFVVMFCHTGDLAEAEAEIATLRGFATPQFELAGPMPYGALYDLTAEATLPTNESVRSLFLHDLSDDVVDTCLEAMAKAPPQSMLQLRTLGGKFAAATAGETAFAHRDSDYLIVFIGVWKEGDGAESTAWTRRYYDRVAHRGSGVYVNFLQDEPERILDAYPPATYRRLAKVKRAYDPENLFCQNQNIRPA